MKTYGIKQPFIMAMDSAGQELGQGTAGVLHDVWGLTWNTQRVGAEATSRLAHSLTHTCLVVDAACHPRASGPFHINLSMWSPCLG